MGLDVKFGVSTWLWTSPFNSDTLSLFPKIKRMGYDFVEIPVEDPSLIDVKKVNEALLENDLKAMICGAFGPSRDFTNDDPVYHHTCFDYIHACVKIASSLGSESVSGPMYSSVGKARLVSPDQKRIEWDRAVINIRKACVMAEDFGVELAIEPLNRFESDLINTAEDVLKLIKDIDHPSAKVILDGFHMNIEERDIEKAIISVGDKLVHLQVSENYRGTPGTGETNWGAYKRGLTAINYNRTVSIESFTPDNKELAGAVCMWRPLVPSQDGFAQEGLEFLKKWSREE